MDANVESQSESEARGPAEKAVAKSPSDSSASNANDAFKPSKKLVRVLTVIGYVISVSLAGVMLSLYYVFLWKPTVNNVRPDAMVALFVGDGDQILPQVMATANKVASADWTTFSGGNDNQKVELSDLPHSGAWHGSTSTAAIRSYGLPEALTEEPNPLSAPGETPSVTKHAEDSIYGYTGGSTRVLRSHRKA